MTILIVAVMILSVIGMMICSKKQKTNPNAQPIAMVLLVVVVVCAALLLWPKNTQQAQMQQENQFAASQGIVLGKYLAANAPGKILLLAETDYKTNKYTQTIAEGLRKGTGGEVVVDTVETAASRKAAAAPAPKGPDGMPGGMPEMTMPLQETMTAKDFDAAVAKHPDAKVVVSLIGLPRDASRLKIWGKTKIAIINAYGRLAGLIEKGWIPAVTISKPKANYEAAYPGDPQKGFELRYILVTSKNIKSLPKKVQQMLSM